jgi:tRNA dimethylallyltransferase
MILAIAGPTGTGKTELALAVARLWDAEIVNADSRQVYRGLDIGSAKPTPAQRAAVPHHLFDVVEPDASFDCARYRELARAAIAEIEGRGRRVLLVGGTGLYLKVLRCGLFPGPPRDEALRAHLVGRENQRPGTLHERLRRVDPAAADRLHPHDRVRLVRALEVYELTDRPLSAWQEAHGFRDAEIHFPTLGLTMPRPALYERLDRRCRSMVEAGLVDEVARLARRGYTSDLEPLRSIGYREIAAYLQGKCELEQAITDMARATRRLAKRQLTWFRADPSVRWFDASAVDAERALAALGMA